MLIPPETATKRGENFGGVQDPKIRKDPVNKTGFGREIRRKSVKKETRNSKRFV